MDNISKLLAMLLGVTSLFVFIVIPTSAADQQGLTIAKVESWLNGYKEAWETLDADKVTLLFTEDATYQEDPYKDPYQGRESIHEYWTTVTADQQDVDFTFEVLSVRGKTGIAHWHSEFIQPSSGSTIILDGIFILEFSQEELCRNLREWWHFKAIPAKEN